jgi:hypothetical protein
MNADRAIIFNNANSHLPFPSVDCKKGFNQQKYAHV